MKAKDIIDAYLLIRKIDNTIPDQVLNFMKMAAIERLSKKELPPPDCHFQDESGKWVWAYSKELIEKTFK